MSQKERGCPEGCVGIICFLIAIFGAMGTGDDGHTEFYWDRAVPIIFFIFGGISTLLSIGDMCGCGLCSWD